MNAGAIACDSAGESTSEPANVAALVHEALCFRNFRLLPTARILLRDDQPVEIGSRAFDLLHILLRSQGAVVERAVIMRHVWPTTTVDESNLRSQVSRLRRALGVHRGLLKTVPGRGYLLAADHGSLAPGDEGAETTRRAALAGAAAPPAGYTTEAEALGALLRSVLDELWELRREIAAERKAVLGDDFGRPPRSANEPSRKLFADARAERGD